MSLMPTNDPVGYFVIQGRSRASLGANIMSRFPVDGRSIERGGAFAYTADCPDCGNPLDLHQPDPFSPDRILGVCPNCGRWVLIDVGSGGRLILKKLPGPFEVDPPQSD